MRRSTRSMNLGVGFLFFSVVFITNANSQTINDLTSPDLTRDIKTSTLSRIANPRVEKLSKACTGKRGKWIFKRETQVDCFSLQIDGFTRSEVGENRIERPLFMSVFDTKEEAESFVRVLGGQVIKDRESITIFKPALVTFLQFPIPKNLVQSSFFAGDSE